ncbi:MAG: metallophosphoesterase [Elusimicrobia bacterium]|nr:metallophosphoesterase [Elusimicrobiota bacterium]
MAPAVWVVLLAHAAFAQRAIGLPAFPIAGAAAAQAGVSATVPPASTPLLSAPAPILRLLKPAMKWLAPANLPAFFDGAAPAAEPPRFLGDGPVPPAQESERDLAALSRPWRTKAQLQRVAEVAAARPEGPVRFQMIGDAEPGRFFFSRMLFNKPDVFERQLAAAQKRGGDFVFQLGDAVSRGVASHFRALFAMLERVGAPAPFLTALGNHDRHKPHGVTNSHLYQRLFGPPNYWYDVGGKVRFVVVDSSAGRMKERQLEWLDEALDTKLQKIVITHMPPVHLTAWTKGVGGFKAGAREFMEILERRGVSRVYMGHIHGLGRIERRGVTYILTGGGGSPLFPLTVERRLHHTLEVEADGTNVREIVHPLDGEPFPL